MINKAIAIAAYAHDGQYRKGTNIPYVSHPFQVMMQAQRITDDQTVLAAALLHDVLEDVAPERYSREDMLHDFGGVVAEYVDEVSEQKMGSNGKLSWRERKEAYISHLASASVGARIIAAADKLSNAQSILDDYEQLGDALWARFNAGMAQQIWYYNAVFAALKESGLNNAVMDDLEYAVRQMTALGDGDE